MRYLERSENIARLIESGFQIAMTTSSRSSDTWGSVLQTAGVSEAFLQKYDVPSQETVVDFLLRDKSQPFSVYTMLELARDNARAARTALTRELWEATNQSWLQSQEALRRPISTRAIPKRLEEIRKHAAMVRGALHGTMLRNDIYDFLHLGSMTERFEATARILDVKYYVLLPSVLDVGGNLDNVQWETILRSVSAYQSYRWLYQGEIDARSIADYLIFDRRFPRSLSFCARGIENHLDYLANSQSAGTPSKAQSMAKALSLELLQMDTEKVIASGLHEFLQAMIMRNKELTSQIETEFRFYR